MLLKYGNLSDDSEEQNINKTQSLLINSCGTYKLSPDNDMETGRPEGRDDYQIIYIASGNGTFYFSPAHHITLGAGNIVIYRPHRMQRYEYEGKCNPEIYWIHFTGSHVEEILQKYGITSDLHYLFVDKNKEYNQIFEKIIFELQCKKPFFTESCTNLFLQLLIMFGRYKINKMTYSMPLSFHKLDEATAYFHEHFNENIDIDDYIKKYETGSCTSLFYRHFKEYTGQTPLQYILGIRLSTAKRMLENTDYSISEISASIGYDNALYFSRLFHKHVGVSPKEYRNSLSKDSL